MKYITKRDYKDIKWVLNEWGEFPTYFSDNACRIVSNHYFAKDEESFFDVVCRVVTEIGKAGYTMGYFQDEGAAFGFARRLGGYLLHQYAAFNSPVYYNLGVNENPQCSACFIQSVEDDMDSILDLAKKEGKLFKHGSGTGTNLSTLRGKGAPLSAGGEASGPVAFMHMYDAVASTIKSGGRTRRAAKMVLLDCDHPDIEEFVACKVEEDRKARKMINAGMDPVEAYDNVRYQNGNHSVRLTDEFMQRATMSDGSMEGGLLDKIAAATWECGDPGVQFTDAINKACPIDKPITASNPCSEFVFIDESACNLASINIQKVDPESELFANIVRDMVFAMDILVSISGYPTKDIEFNSKYYRPIGLGLTGAGASLMMEGIEYGSIEAFEALESTALLLRREAVQASVELHSILGSPWGGSMRNAQLTLMAPTGTISFMMDTDSTGIEPVMAEHTVKYLSDGTTMEMEPLCVEVARTMWGEGKVKTALGKNPVTPVEHLYMMQAMQPYLSGAISKTINMPHDCTPEDIREIYVKAWEMGLKCVAVYRDGSKAYQPVEKVFSEWPDPGEGIPVGNINDVVFVSEPATPNGRVRLPDTRDSTTHKFSVGGVEGYLTVGLYSEGYPGEIFLNISKEGSTIGGLCDAWATAFSMGLQYGVPLDKLCRKFKGSSFSPSGFTGSDEIRSATSIVDYVASWLELRFLGADDIDIQDEESGDDIPTYRKEIPYLSGGVCPECGKPTSRTGSCTTCPYCGWNGGCG